MLLPLILIAGLLAAPGPRYREYVALGDSWSADVTLTNVSTEHAPSGCLQASYNYPKQVARALGATTFRDATCSGATTEEMTRPQPVRLVPRLYDGVNAAQFDRLTPRTDLVTLGIGGNDAKLAAAALSCINILPTLTLLPGVVLPAPLGAPCKAKWVTAEGDAMSRNIRRTGPKVAATVRAIRARAPHARILLVDYLAGLPATGGCYPYVQMTDQDADWLGDKLDELNRMLRRVAKAEKVTLVDTYSGSVGHDACQRPGVKWVEGVLPVTTDPLGPAVPLHPNRLGADHQARSVLATLVNSDL
ncbi:SGNH/GDSL hydrolase family protein [Nonomuraea sp. NPDC050310]|uniref:SGNH/GDSL hydrolase family protein n=1 Tax=Nonomuraea sp. NPDC050310 TaxID=3154935 RepID=UPI00340FA0F9